MYLIPGYKDSRRKVHVPRSLSTKSMLFQPILGQEYPPEILQPFKFDH